MAESETGGPAGQGEVVEVDLNDPAAAARFTHIGMVCERYLAMFVPEAYAGLSAEQFQGLVLGIFREELMIDEKVRPLFSVDQAKDNQSILLQLTTAGQPTVRFSSKRRLEHCNNVQEVIAWALLVAFTDSPGLRAVLRVSGMTYMWLAPSTSRIVLAKG